MIQKFKYVFKVEESVRFRIVIGFKDACNDSYDLQDSVYKVHIWSFSRSNKFLSTINRLSFKNLNKDEKIDFILSPPPVNKYYKISLRVYLRDPPLCSCSYSLNLPNVCCNIISQFVGAHSSQIDVDVTGLRV